MSWSFSAIGKPLAVIEKARTELVESAYRCPEPEETAKKSVFGIIESLLSAFPASSAVKILASGSQYSPDHKKPTEAMNNLRLEIEPVHGFVD